MAASCSMDLAQSGGGKRDNWVVAKEIDSVTTAGVGTAWQ